MKKSEKPDVQNIPVDQIEVTDRLRAVDAAAVDDIALSMGGKKGDKSLIIQPIVVHSVNHRAYRLIAGAHRLAAAKKLAWNDIPALVLTGLKENELRQVEIDENLRRRELSPGEYADFATMKIRLALGEQDNRGRLLAVRELEDGPDMTAEYIKIAALSDISADAVYRAVSRRRSLDHVWDKLKGTDAFNNGAALDRLRKKFSTNADKVVDAALREHGGNIEAAMDAMAPPRTKQKTSIPAEEALKNLRKAWKTCPAPKREKFVAENLEEISTIIATLEIKN